MRRPPVFGAVETPQEGQVFANFLQQNQGKFDGVILSLPNFGDENGAVTALKEAGGSDPHPSLSRRVRPHGARPAAGCLLWQIFDHGCVLPAQSEIYRSQTACGNPIQRAIFKANLDHFDRVCRVAKGIPPSGDRGDWRPYYRFQNPVRFDEVALQSRGCHPLNPSTFPACSPGLNLCPQRAAPTKKN